uniref:Uncharacterized protein n=1 Tax=Arundo donax TaxID=35708 RepID=A0A0A9BF13_ARUDO
MLNKLFCPISPNLTIQSAFPFSIHPTAIPLHKNLIFLF